MRPVLLEMAGFGSFREPTTVDFAGVEYFALVGPTGAGKSTVIDAMTFALYGSVPRWDNARTVALALAPTVARGTVRFVFDVAGRAGDTERYVVARELRRAASGGVSVRTARLERLRDPAGTGAVEEETEPVADGAAATTKAVEELLGLPFGDFTTCVVLPQGEFAEFLHAKPADRQKILTRLLGLGVYDEIRAAANEQAKASQHGAEALDKQLAGYQDATEDAERTASARVDTLIEVVALVDGALAEITTRATAADLAGAELARVQRERDLLAAGGRRRPDEPADRHHRERDRRGAGARRRRARRQRGPRRPGRRTRPRSAGAGGPRSRRAGPAAGRPAGGRGHLRCRARHPRPADRRRRRDPRRPGRVDRHPRRGGPRRRDRQR
jgi:exonuclease SbcC